MATKKERNDFEKALHEGTTLPTGIESWSPYNRDHPLNKRTVEKAAEGDDAASTRTTRPSGQTADGGARGDS